MARKNQQNAAFGTDAAPNNVSMPTLNSQQRQTSNELQGRIRRDITRQPSPVGNPYRPGDSDSWGSQHLALLGF
jgi:hypothetical protein